MAIEKILLSAIILSISSTLIACDSLFYSHNNPLPIEKITEGKNERKLYIAGEVVRTIYLVKNGAYLLQDDTKGVWIMTKNKLPSVGDKLSIKGEVKSQKLPFNEEELYLQEIEVKPYSQTELVR